MVTKLQTKQSGNADLDAVFDPYVQGTSPPATGFNVGGTTTDINTRFAPIVFGSAAAATGLLTKQSGNADLNTLFAAYGTASYSLPFNGETFFASGSTSGSGSVFASVTFNITLSGWTVTTDGTGSGSVVQASGATPSGAVSAKITDTWLDSPGDSDAGSVTNSCVSITAIPSSGGVGISIREGGSTAGQTTHQSVILLYNSAGTVISTTTYQSECITSKG